MVAAPGQARWPNFRHRAPRRRRDVIALHAGMHGQLSSAQTLEDLDAALLRRLQGVNGTPLGPKRLQASMGHDLSSLMCGPRACLAALARAHDSAEVLRYKAELD
jgi:hypothetical protein